MGTQGGVRWTWVQKKNGLEPFQHIFFLAETVVEVEVRWIALQPGQHSTPGWVWNVAMGWVLGVVVPCTTIMGYYSGWLVWW